MLNRVLITGGAGFIGSHLADKLLERGYNVRIFDNLTPQVHGAALPSYLSRDVEFIPGDVRNEEQVIRAIRDVDVVFHLAAAIGVGQSMYEIARYMGTNSQGTAVLLQALLQHQSRAQKLIVASSMSIYGEGTCICIECGIVEPSPRSRDYLRRKNWELQCPNCSLELSPIATPESKQAQATSIYALSKRAQEDMCLLFGRTYGLPVVALRYFNIYGPRQALSNPYTGVAAIFAARLLNHRAPLIFEDGRQMRDFVSIQDVVQANLLAMTRSQADGLALNVGSGRPISICEVAEALSRALDAPQAAEITGKYRAGDIRHCFGDITLARELLGYEPKISFADGVRELVEWLRAQEAEDKAAEAVAQLSSFGLTA